MTTALARLGVAHGADLPYVTDEELEGTGLAPVQRRKLREAAAAAGGGAPAATSLLSPTSSAVQAMISDMSPVSSNPTANADHAVDSSSADGGGGSPPEADAKVDAAERRLEEVEAELRRERIMRTDGEQTLQAEREVLAAMQQMQIAQTEERQRCDAVFVCCLWVGERGERQSWRLRCPCESEAQDLAPLCRCRAHAEAARQTAEAQAASAASAVQHAHEGDGAGSVRVPSPSEQAMMDRGTDTWRKLGNEIMSLETNSAPFPCTVFSLCPPAPAYSRHLRPAPVFWVTSGPARS